MFVFSRFAVARVRARARARGGGGGSQDEYGYQYPCVKARGIIGGSAEEVMGMIVDSTRVLEYNRRGKSVFVSRRSIGFLF